jgi:hypothetical protein
MPISVASDSDPTKKVQILPDPDPQHCIQTYGTRDSSCSFTVQCIDDTSTFRI